MNEIGFNASKNAKEKRVIIACGLS